MLPKCRPQPFCLSVITVVDVMNCEHSQMYVLLLHSDIAAFIATLGPIQHDRHFTNDIFKCVFLNENVGISINISLKFVPRDLINNIPALVQIMAWRRPGDKPLSQPMIFRLLTHICVIRPQWVTLVNILRPKTKWPPFVDYTFKCIFFKRLVLIWIKEVCSSGCNWL